MGDGEGVKGDNDNWGWWNEVEKWIAKRRQKWHKEGGYSW